EVRLPLSSGVDSAELLRGLVAQAPDVLLALPALDVTEVAGTVWQRSVTATGGVELSGPNGVVHRWWTYAAADQQYRWARPIDDSGERAPLGADVLHAPTPTDERLSLPMRLIATLPIEPSRRTVRPGADLDTALRNAALGYVELVRAVPAGHRLS